MGPGNEPTLRLRIVWGGGPAERWQGSLYLDDGELADATPLGLEPDEPGSLWIESGYVHVASPSPRKFDGLDVSVRADLDARLTIDLSTETSSRPPIEISLAELLRDTQTHALDEAGNRLSARRAPGDGLRVRPPPGGLVLSPGERLPLGLQPRWLGVDAGSKVRIDFELRPARGTRSLWTSAREIDWPAPDLPQPDLVEEIRAPQTPGAYDLTITASSRSLRQRFGLKQTLAERQVQFVVVDATPAAPEIAAPRLVAELDPTASRWWEQLARLPGTQRWWRGPVGSSSAAVVDHELGRVVELRPRGGDASRAGEPSWEAYPLSIDRIGECHVLEIDYPGDKRQRLGVCVMESAGAGPLAPLAIDQGLICETPDDGAPQWRRHRITFWPRSKNPVILLMNRAPTDSAWFGKLRVYQSPADAGPVAPEGTQREWLAHCDRPLLADTLGGSQRLDALTGQTIDDWQTFYEAAEHLAEYLKVAGYSGVALTVAGEGSALYPSPFLQPTPRYDTGIFSSHGHDPIRKDVLELLLRVFDRHGLRFVPVVRFTTPLPALEAARRAGGPSAEGLTWFSAHGERGLDRRPPREGAAAYYNPLDPRVQRAFVEIVDELAGRCRNHPSFAGVAVRVEHEGSARLQGVEWGLDRQTLSRFAAAAGLDAGSLAPGDVLTTHREAWVAWRAAQMTGLVRSWEQRVVAARPDAKLQLLGMGLYSLPELQGALRPQLPWVASSADALREAGFELEVLRQQPGIVTAVSRRGAGPADGDVRRLRLERDRARDLSDALGRGGASFQWREGRAEPLTGVDLRGPLRSPPTASLSQQSPDSRASRRRFVESLARSDALTFIDGGTMLGLVVDADLAALMKVYRRLPAVVFGEIPGPAQPVVARQATIGGQTFVYLVNTAPWPTVCRLRFDGPAATRAEVWANRELPAPPIAPQTVWEPALEGHDLVALRIDAPDVKVQVERVEFDASQLASLDQRIRDLMGRATGLQGVRRYEALANASFEQPPAPAEAVPSWKLLSSSGATAQIEGAPAHEGNFALRLSNPSGVAVMASAPFRAPTTGRLTVGAWIRVSRFDAGSQLRIAVRGIGSDYYRAAPLPADPATPTEPWRWCALRLDDLVEEGAPLEVRFEIRGAGDVIIDDVRTFDIDFSQAEKIGLAQILHLAEAQLRVEKVAECRETLEGYWPQFLAEHVAAPLTPSDEVPAGPVVRQAARAPAAAPEPAPESGMLDSIKRLVPRSLRWY